MQGNLRLYWLIVAISYWTLLYRVFSHSNLVCRCGIINKHIKQNNDINTLLILHEWDVDKETFCQTSRSIKTNVHFCLENTSEHFLPRIYRTHMRVMFNIKNHFFSTTKYPSGPPIKWWEGIGQEVERSNNLLYATLNVSKMLSLFSEKDEAFDFIHRFVKMAQTSSTRHMDVCIVDENEIITTSQKRTTSALATSSQKKAKNKKDLKTKYSSLWLGFQALNLIHKEREVPIENIESTRELMKRKIDFDEAKEMQHCRPSFPYVPQREWPSKREDGKEGQHYNLTQLPFDIEVDEDGFSFDYQVAIHFELGETKWERDVIMHKVKERLSIMHIELGDLIGEPIAIMCFHKSTTWSGVIKLHLKNPVIDGKSLLQGTKAFILTFDDGKAWRGKVCKTYDVLALNNLLSVKITSETLIGKEWYNILEEVVHEGFDRTYEYEITTVQKKKEMSFAWIVATSPEQAKKINTYKISLDNEIFEAKFTSRDKLTEDDKARKNALILIVKNLNKIKDTETIEYELKKHMGERNVLNIFFKIENGKHIGSCNVQCLNAAVYKKFVKKNVKLLGKYIEFTPHPKSLDGINAPSQEELTRLGFSDVNTALANTVEALENAPTKGLTRQEVKIMMEGETSKLRKELAEREELVYRRATTYTDKSMKSIAAQLTIFKQQLLTTVNYIESVAKDLEGGPDEGNMDLSN